VDESDLKRLEEVGTKVEFPAEKVLIERGQPGAGLYVVLEGHVLVEAPESEYEFGPGSVVGERALFAAHGKRAARVRALTDCVMIAVERVEIERLCAEDAAFAERLARSS
jgi:CRP-like cAMP-binding protein